MSKASHSVIGAVFAIVSGAALSSCLDQLECGEGTVNRNGTCVAADLGVGNGQCGPGTRLEDGVCKPNCDPNTTMPVTENGVTTCVGLGGGALPPCDQEIVCPTQTSSGKMNVCGRFYDVETDAKIQLDSAPALCTAGAGGPCAIGGLFVDAIKFANNPTDPAAPLPVDSPIQYDTCGRFKAEGVTNPDAGFAAIGSDDAPGGGDDYVLTGVGFSAATRTHQGIRAYVLQKATDTKWGNKSPMGLYVSVYIGRNRLPVPGVTMSFNGNSTDYANNDFYFTDTAPNLRASITADGPTRADGTAVWAGQTPGNQIGLFGGVGGDLGTDTDGTECVWHGTPGKAVPGVAFVQLRDVVRKNTEIPCAPL